MTQLHGFLRLFAFCVGIFLSFYGFMIFFQFARVFSVKLCPLIFWNEEITKLNVARIRIFGSDELVKMRTRVGIIIVICLNFASRLGSMSTFWITKRGHSQKALKMMYFGEKKIRQIFSFLIEASSVSPNAAQPYCTVPCVTNSKSRTVQRQNGTESWKENYMFYIEDYGISIWYINAMK